MVKTQCQSCHKLIEMPDPPSTRIINLPAVSLIVMEHPEITKCPNCETLLSHGITSIDGLGLTGIPLPGQEKEPLLVRPNGMKIV